MTFVDPSGQFVDTVRSWAFDLEVLAQPTGQGHAKESPIILDARQSNTISLAEEALGESWSSRPGLPQLTVSPTRGCGSPGDLRTPQISLQPPRPATCGPVDADGELAPLRTCTACSRTSGRPAPPSSCTPGWWAAQAADQIRMPSRGGPRSCGR